MRGGVRNSSFAFKATAHLPSDAHNRPIETERMNLRCYILGVFVYISQLYTGSCYMAKNGCLQHVVFNRFYINDGPAQGHSNTPLSFNSSSTSHPESPLHHRSYQGFHVTHFSGILSPHELFLRFQHLGLYASARREELN